MDLPRVGFFQAGGYKGMKEAGYLLHIPDKLYLPNSEELIIRISTNRIKMRHLFSLAPEEKLNVLS